MTIARAALLVTLVAVLGAAAWFASAWWWLREAVPAKLEFDWQAVAVTIAGDGVVGHVDGPGLRARFSDPFGIAISADGTIFVADAGGSSAVRRIAPDGTVSTLAGGSRGVSDGIGRAAQFDTPSGLTIDAGGVLYVADTANDAIRRIAADGTVSTLVARTAGLKGPIGIAALPDGRLAIADTYNDRIVSVASDGAITPVAGGPAAGFDDGPGDLATFDTPCGIAADLAGNLYVADLGNGAIRILSRDGHVRTLSTDGATGPFRPMGLAVFDSSVYVADDRGRILELRLDGTSRVVAGAGGGFSDGLGAEARFRAPAGIAVAAPGRLVTTDRRNALIRRIDALSQLDRLTPGPPLAPRFDAESFERLPLLWPFEPLEGPFEITGTLGEPRGTAGSERFHAGLDIQSPEGTPVHTVRAGVVDHPLAISEFGSLNESIRIGEMAYVHLRVGRDRRNRAALDPRLVFSYDDRGRVSRVRVRRGARFSFGDVVGTVNGFYHAHLNVGWPGEERNPLLSRLVNFEDTVPPVIARNGIRVFREDGEELKTRTRKGIVLSERVRIVVDAWDQVNGNLPRRRLGLYRLGYQVLHGDGTPLPEFGGMRETIRFDRQPADPLFARIVYAGGSGIPVYGNRSTRFLYAVTSTLRNGIAEDGVLDTSSLPDGHYLLRVLAADIAGNEAIANRDLPVVVSSSGRLDQR